MTNSSRMKPRLPTLLLVFFLKSAYAESELLSVHTVFRHGARAPIEESTTEEGRAFFFRGPGQLTDQGLQQSELVGRLFRDRYLNTSFLDKRMIPDEVHFQSSAAERCLMTISRVANTMFPNNGPPIITLSKDDDFLLVPKFTCQTVLNDFRVEFNLTDEEYEKAKTDIWDISDKALLRAAENTKILKTKLDQIQNVPALILEKDVGLAVPSWFTDEAYDEAQYVFYNSLSVFAGVTPYYHPSWMRMNSGFLLYTIIKNIEEKVQCEISEKCSKTKKFYAYSTHDINMLSLLESLGIRESALRHNRAPEFLSLVIFELWMIDGEPKVKILYRQRPDDTNLLNLSGNVRNCGNGSEFCEVANFTSCCSDFITGEPEEQCMSRVLEVKWAWNNLTWIIFSFCTSFLIIIIVLMCLIYKIRKEYQVSLKY